MQAALVIDGDFLVSHHSLHTFQFFFFAETAVRVSLIDQLLRVFLIDTLRLTFTLYIGAHSAILVGTFVMHKAGSLHGTIDNIHGSFHQTFLVGILDPEDKVSSLMLGDQICI